jgi:hypothetical protein
MKIRSACARLLAGFFAILFIIAALISLLLVNAEHHFVDPELYKRVLLEERVYDSLPRLLSTQISAGMTFNPCAEDPSACEGEGEDVSEDDEGGPPDYFKNMEAEQWELLLGEILSANWLQAQTESVIDQLFVFLDSDDTTPSITISLADLKSRLMGRNGVETVLKIIEAQPTCTQDQLREIINSFESDDSSTELLSCRPPQEILDEYLSSMVETLNEVIESLPDEVVLGENLMDSDLDEEIETDEDEMQVGKTLRRVRTYMRLSPIVPIGFLLLIAVFGVRSFREFLQWWGIPLLLTGLIALVFSILSMPIFNWFIKTYVQVQIPGYFSSEFVGLGFDIGRSMIRSLVKAITIQAGVLSLGGILMSVASAFIKQRRTEPVE